MTDPKYAAFTALDPFFEISQQGLADLVDGDHYFDTMRCLSFDIFFRAGPNIEWS